MHQRNSMDATEFPEVPSILYHDNSYTVTKVYKKVPGSCVIWTDLLLKMLIDTNDRMIISRIMKKFSMTHT